MESHSGLRRSYLTGSGAAQGDLWGLSNFAMLLSGVIERLKSVQFYPQSLSVGRVAAE
jgi:hypothetical protein